MELSDPARKELAAISSSLLSWFYENHRDLPWRSDRTPYSTWISEAMLQQTRVTTVLDYYPRFLNRFPDPSSLAKASEDEVLKLWEGLGYYSRARNLKRGAEYICEHFGGILPSDPDLLLKIPGIGPARRKELLKAFGSLKAIREADIGALAEVKGMNRAAAEAVRAWAEQENGKK